MMGRHVALCCAISRTRPHRPLVQRAAQIHPTKQNGDPSEVAVFSKCLSHLGFFWWPGTESNRRHKDFQSSALPTELPGLSLKLYPEKRGQKRVPKIFCVVAELAGQPRLPRPRSTPSCRSLRYRWVRSSPVFSATRVIEPPSRARWNSKYAFSNPSRASRSGRSRSKP